MLKTMGVNQKLPTFVLLIHLIMQLTETYSHETELTMKVEKPEKKLDKVQANLKTDGDGPLKTIFIVEAAPDLIDGFLSNLTKETSGNSFNRIIENGKVRIRNKRDQEEIKKRVFDKKLTSNPDSLENVDRIGFLGNYELQKINAMKTVNGANRALNDSKKSNLVKEAVPVVSNRQSNLNKKVEPTQQNWYKSERQNDRRKNQTRKVNPSNRSGRNVIPVQTQVPLTYTSTPRAKNIPPATFQRRSFDLNPDDSYGKVSKRNSDFGTRAPISSLPYSSFTNHPLVTTNPAIYKSSPPTFNPPNYHSSTHNNFLDQKLAPSGTQNYDSTRKPVFELLAKYDNVPRPFAAKPNLGTGFLEHLETHRNPVYQASQYNVPPTLSPNNFHATNLPRIHQYSATTYADTSSRRPPAPSPSATPERNYNDYNSFVQRTLTPQSPYATYPQPVSTYATPTRPPYQEYDYNSNNNFELQQVPRKTQKEKPSKVSGQLTDQFNSYKINKEVGHKYEPKKLQSAIVVNPYQVVENSGKKFQPYDIPGGINSRPKIEVRNSGPGKEDYNYEVTERSFNDFASSTLFPFKSVAAQSKSKNVKTEDYVVDSNNEVKENDVEANSQNGYKVEESEEKRSDVNFGNKDSGSNFEDKKFEKHEEVVTDSNIEPSEPKLTADSHKEPKDEKFEEGEGGEHEQMHHEEENESGEKFYDSKHEHEKGEKGHYDKEDHTHKYNEKEGHKTDSEDEGRYEKVYHKEGEGDKETTFEEKGEHSKGHSTKGKHVIHKNDEFEKETEFFDEFIEEDGDEKEGGYHHEHHNEKGGDYKSGHYLSELGDEKHGKGGQFAKGHSRHEDEGHKQDEAHDQYHEQEQKHGNEGKHSDSKTWEHKKGRK